MKYVLLMNCVLRLKETFLSSSWAHDYCPICPSCFTAQRKLKQEQPKYTYTLFPIISVPSVQLFQNFEVVTVGRNDSISCHL